MPKGVDVGWRWGSRCWSGGEARAMLALSRPAGQMSRPGRLFWPAGPGQMPGAPINPRATGAPNRKHTGPIGCAGSPHSGPRRCWTRRERNSWMSQVCLLIHRGAPPTCTRAPRRPRWKSTDCGASDTSKRMASPQERPRRGLGDNGLTTLGAPLLPGRKRSQAVKASFAFLGPRAWGKGESARAMQNNMHTRARLRTIWVCLRK